MAFGTALIGLASTLAPKIIDYFGNANNNNKDIKDKELDVQKLLIEQGTSEFNSAVQLAMEQVKLNNTLATAGKLGWRDWLGSGLTIVLLFFLGQVALAFGVNWIAGVFGHPLPQLVAALANFPYDILNSVWNMLGLLLGGLYVGRGMEKIQYSKQQTSLAATPVNYKVFFDTLRSLYGRGLTEAEVQAFNTALNKASER